MRKLFAACVFIVCTALMFTSCQKELGFTEDLLVTGDSVVSKIVILDTSFASGSDTAYVTVFTYDGNQRLSKIQQTYYNLGVSGSIDDTEDQTYRYTGTQTLPYRIEDVYTDLPSGTTDRDTSHYTYTGDYISRDSVSRAGGEYFLSSFTRIGTNRYKNINKTGNASGVTFIDSQYISLTWAGGNLVKQVDSLFLPAGGWDVSTVTASYDTKANPFKPFVIPHPAPYGYHAAQGVALTELSVGNTNNMTAQSGGPMGTVTLNYQYGPTGLPKIVRGLGTLKYFYYYKAL